MKISISFISAMSMLLSLITCAKEQDEVYTDEEDAYREANYGKTEVTADAATASWSQFMKDAKTAILISEKNVHVLEIMASKTSGEEEAELNRLHDATAEKIKSVKQALAKRDAAFKKEAKHYDQDVAKRNEAFIKQFRREMFDLNIEMEQILEE